MPARRTYSLAVAVFFIAFYLLTAGGHYYSQDGKELWRVTCSLASPPLFPSQYGILPSLLGLPFLALGALAGAAGLTTGRPEALMFFGSLQNAVWCGLLVGLFFRAAARLYSPRRALVLALGLGLATLVWPYSKLDFYEPLATFLLLWLFTVLMAWRERGGRGAALQAGLIVGLMLHTRLDSLLLFPLAGLFVALSGRPRAEQWRALAWQTAGFVPLLALAAGFNYLRFGSIFADPRLAQESFSTPLLYGLYGQLLSPGRSLFYYSPLLVLTFFGWRAWWRERRPELLFILGVTALYLLLYGQWCNWSANWCYGNRYLLKVVPLLTLPVGSLLGRGRGAGNTAFILLALLGLGLQLMAVAVEFNDPLNEILGVIAAETDYSQVDPLLSLPVWNAGIIDGRGLIPGLYDFAWLNLPRFGLARVWLVVPLLLLPVLLLAAWRLRLLLRGLSLWLLLALALLALALLALGIGANTGRHVTLSVYAPDAADPYLVIPARNINFIDYFGQWQNIHGIRPGSILVWRGTLDCPVGGVGYKFGLLAHGPAELVLDGQVLTVNVAQSGTKFVSAPVELLKGRHRIEVRYRPPDDGSAAARATLYWWLPYTSLGVVYGEHFVAE